MHNFTETQIKLLLKSKSKIQQTLLSVCKEDIIFKGSLSVLHMYTHTHFKLYLPRKTTV